MIYRSFCIAAFAAAILSVHEVTTQQHFPNHNRRAEGHAPQTLALPSAATATVAAHDVYHHDALGLSLDEAAPVPAPEDDLLELEGATDETEHHVSSYAAYADGFQTMSPSPTAYLFAEEDNVGVGIDIDADADYKSTANGISVHIIDEAVLSKKYVVDGVGSESHNDPMVEHHVVVGAGLTKKEEGDDNVMVSIKSSDKFSDEMVHPIVIADVEVTAGQASNSNTYDSTSLVDHNDKTSIIAARRGRHRHLQAEPPTYPPTLSPTVSPTVSRWPSLPPALQFPTSPPVAGSFKPTTSASPTMSASPTKYCEDTKIRFEVIILLDNFPHETSWTLTNECGSGGVIVIRSEDYSGRSNERVTFEECIENGDYEFEIMDSYGDGILGRGFYEIKFQETPGGRGVDSYSGGGDFGSSDIQRHPGECPSAEPSALPSMSMDPSSEPSATPSINPSIQPSTIPSEFPSEKPSMLPTTRPSDKPSQLPSMKPSSTAAPPTTPPPTSNPPPTTHLTDTEIGQGACEDCRGALAFDFLTLGGTQASPVACQDACEACAAGDANGQELLGFEFSTWNHCVCLFNGVPDGTFTASTCAAQGNPAGTDPQAIDDRRSMNGSGEICGANGDLDIVCYSKVDAVPSSKPSDVPSMKPSMKPSTRPSMKPSDVPSVPPPPTNPPTPHPTTPPSIEPSKTPSVRPSNEPSVRPSTIPSGFPSMKPSMLPSMKPSMKPSASPSVQPSSTPSISPSASAQPSCQEQHPSASDVKSGSDCGCNFCHACFRNKSDLKVAVNEFMKVSGSAPTATRWNGMIDDVYYGSNIEEWCTGDVDDMSELFKDLEISDWNWDLSGWNTGKVVSMQSMFETTRFFSENVFDMGISSWDTASVTDMSSMFHQAEFFNVRPSTSLANWNVASVTNMQAMFSGILVFRDITGDISGWDTASVTDMSSMFSGMTYFESDISRWDTASVTDMSEMFFEAIFFDADISSWDTASVTDMSGMFYFAKSFNADVSGWETASVTDMSEMFAHAESFQPTSLVNWNVASVKNMEGMFAGASLFDADISSWDTASVTDMSGMFSGAKTFNADVSGWETASVTDMSYMFANADSFQPTSLALVNWNVASVENMQDMFIGAHLFNADISGWDTTSVTNMNYMFFHAKSFNVDISDWKTASVKEMNEMFYGAELFKQNLCSWKSNFPYDEAWGIFEGTKCDENGKTPERGDDFLCTGPCDGGGAQAEAKFGVEAEFGLNSPVTDTDADAIVKSAENEVENQVCKDVDSTKASTCTAKADNVNVNGSPVNQNSPSSRHLRSLRSLQTDSTSTLLIEFEVTMQIICDTADCSDAETLGTELYNQATGNLEDALEDGSFIDEVVADLSGYSEIQAILASAEVSVSVEDLVTTIVQLSSEWYPDWENVGCKNDGDAPTYMSMEGSVWIEDSKEACCEKFFGWAYSDCVGESAAVPDGYYPLWGVSEPKCASGNPPNYMRRNPAGWMFDTINTCCERYFGWSPDCVTNSGGSSGPDVTADLYYADWERSNTCVSDGNAPGYMRSNPKIWMFDTLLDCCDTNYFWGEEYIKCLTSEGASAPTSSPIQESWYVDWGDQGQGACVKSCVGPSPCGGMHQSWNTLHSTLAECCEAHLWWEKDCTRIPR